MFKQIECLCQVYEIRNLLSSPQQNSEVPFWGVFMFSTNLELLFIAIFMSLQLLHRGRGMSVLGSDLAFRPERLILTVLSAMKIMFVLYQFVSRSVDNTFPQQVKHLRTSE